MNNLANIGLGTFFISSKGRALVSNPMNFVAYAFFSTGSRRFESNDLDCYLQHKIVIL